MNDVRIDPVFAQEDYETAGKLYGAAALDLLRYLAHEVRKARELGRPGGVAVRLLLDPSRPKEMDTEIKLLSMEPPESFAGICDACGERSDELRDVSAGKFVGVSMCPDCLKD